MNGTKPMTAASFTAKDNLFLSQEREAKDATGNGVLCNYMSLHLQGQRLSKYFIRQFFILLKLNTHVIICLVNGGRIVK